MGSDQLAKAPKMRTKEDEVTESFICLFDDTEVVIYEWL